MHFASRHGDYPVQRLLWRYVEAGRLLLHGLAEGEAARMRDLMERYRDAPMDLADASLVSAAEQTGLARVLTFDGHFHAYRIYDRNAFEVIS
jgi:predicted nucleic acid-binding protein